MAEKFRINGSFWYGTAVDGEIFLATAWRVVVNDTWDDFLANATKSVGATCRATSSTRLRASQLPTMLYRCLRLCSSELFI